MNTLSLTPIAFSILLNEGAAPTVTIFRDNVMELPEGLLVEFGQLANTKQDCEALIRAAAFESLSDFLDQKEGTGSAEIRALCETIVKLHRFTNAENKSLRSLFRQNDNGLNFQKNYRLALQLLPSLPDSLFVQPQTVDLTPEQVAEVAV